MKKHHGFTLLEVAFVMFIVALIAEGRACC